MKNKSIWLLCLLLIASSILACGKKAPPTPVEKNLPAQTDGGR